MSQSFLLPESMKPVFSLPSQAILLSADSCLKLAVHHSPRLQIASWKKLVIPVAVSLAWRVALESHTNGETGSIKAGRS